MTRRFTSTRPSLRLTGCLLGLIAGSGLPSLALAQQGGQSPVVRQLIDQGNYWHQRSRDDLAADTWQKLLRIDPQQPDALLGLAQIELARGNTTAAQARLQQLQKAQPNAPQTAQLRNLLAGGTDALQSARQAAAAGNYPEAIRQYQSLFDGPTPPPQLALEYYQVLAGTPAGWQQARDGLAKLAAARPNDDAVALAYAQVLTYREPTRREGIRLLQGLAGKGAAATPARAAWKQALLWLDAGAADGPLFRDYLAQSPDDEAIRQRLDSLAGAEAAARQASDPAQRAINAGYKALNANQLAEAESQFMAALKARPNDAEALGGLGSVRLKQQRFGEAQELLARASRSAPGKWKQALDSARYWSNLQQASTLSKNGQPAQAAALLQDSVKLDPREPQGYAALGSALAGSGQDAAAEQAFRQALTLQPGNPSALAGLADLYTRQGKSAQALALLQQATPAQRAAMGGEQAIRANQHRVQAQQYLQQGQGELAQRELEAGLVDAPADPWLRLDLARLYLHQGRAEQARSVMSGLLLAHPDDPQALYANALFASEQNDWTGVQRDLGRIPEAQRSAEMNTLLQQAWLQQQTASAAQLARQGRTAQAQALLGQVEQRLGPQLASQPDLLATLASAYADAGNPQRAVQLAQGLLSGSDGNSLEARLRYAQVLAATHQDAELAATLRMLKSQPMNPAQQGRFDQLLRAYTLRQVDALRQQGNLEAAYNALAPVLAAAPHDPQVLSALARLYAQANDQAQALKLYQQILASQPGNQDALLAAADTAAAMHQLDTAEGYVRQALAQAPDSPQVLAAAGRMYRIAGKNGKAEDYLRAALAAQARQNGNPSNGLPVVGNDAGLAPSNQPFNPFSGMTGGANPRQPVNLPAAPLAQLAAAQAPAASWSPGLNPLPAAPAASDIPDPVNATAPAAPPVPGGVAPVGMSTGVPVPVPTDVPAPPAYPVAGSPPPSRRVASAPPAKSGDPILDDLLDLQSKYASSVSTGVVYRSREGEAGLGKVDDIEVPVQAKIAVGDGKLTVSATPTLLDGGKPDSGYATASRFGAGPAAALSGALAGNTSVLTTLTGSDLYQALLSQGDTQATRNLIYNAALSSGEYNTLYNATDATLPANQRQAQALAALYAEPLPAYILGNNLSNTPIGTIASTVLNNSALSAGLSPDQQAMLRQLAGSSAASMTPTQFQNRLYTMAASAAGARRLSSQDASGVGLSLGYQLGGFEADVGSTPLGFKQTNVVGGVGYRGSIGEEISYTANLSRRAVSDSMLSFAGVEDPRAGLRWGGVVANGARLGMTWDNQLWGVYGNLGYAQLTGHNVADNTREEASTGVYVHAIDTDTQSLTGGLNLTAMHYDKNLSGFTYGQGGYFSPQRYVEVGFPVHWNGHTSTLTWKIDASVGVQSFKEDASPYFPTDPAMQQAAYDAASIAALLGFSNGYIEPVYNGQTKTGLSYNLGGAVEWQLAPQLFLGSRMELNNARNYRQFATSLYLRFLLDHYGASTPSQPAPLLSPYTPP